MSDSCEKYKASLQKGICPHWLERSKYSCPLPLCVQPGSLNSKRMEAGTDLPGTQHEPWADSGLLLSCWEDFTPAIGTEVFCIRNTVMMDNSSRCGTRKENKTKASKTKWNGSNYFWVNNVFGLTGAQHQRFWLKCLCEALNCSSDLKSVLNKETEDQWTLWWSWSLCNKELKCWRVLALCGICLFLFWGAFWVFLCLLQQGLDLSPGVLGAGLGSSFLGALSQSKGQWLLL